MRRPAPRVLIARTEVGWRLMIEGNPTFKIEITECRCGLVREFPGRPHKWWLHEPANPPRREPTAPCPCTATPCRQGKTALTCHGWHEQGRVVALAAKLARTLKSRTAHKPLPLADTRSTPPWQDQRPAWWAEYAVDLAKAEVAIAAEIARLKA